MNATNVGPSTQPSSNSSSRHRAVAPFVGRPAVSSWAVDFPAQMYCEIGHPQSVDADSTLYQSQVFTASHGDSSNYRSPRFVHGAIDPCSFYGIRLGIKGVNPIYYDIIKRLYEFPQSVGIAGGRPGSSYYFVGSQEDNLFYLDSHHARPAIPHHW